LMPTCGGTQRMIERAGWGNAMRYLLTGDEFSAADGYRMGFIQEVTDPGAVFERALVIAHKVADQAPLAVQAVINNARTTDLEGMNAAIDQLSSASAALGKSNDSKEGLQSFVERRKAKYTGT
jgi:enoyl-CoA hydratase